MTRRNARKRICLFGLVSKHPARNRGGTAVSILRLANFFAGKGLRVDILMRTVEPDHFLFSQLVGDVKVFQARASGKLGLFLGLLRYASRQRPDVLLALDSKASLIASWLTGIPGLKTSVWSSFCAKPNPDHASVLRRIARRSRGVIAVSNGLADDFCRLTGLDREKVHVIYNPVVSADLKAKAVAFVDHPWLEKNISPVLLSVGRLVPEKGFEYLIRALPAVRACYPDVRLIVLGEGPLLPDLRALAAQLALQDRVDFIGFRENPWAFMAKADLFVLPSLAEAFGNVLAEAMSLGVPVVATDCPYGPPEILAQGRYGPLARPADSEDLAAAILQALGEPLPAAELQLAAQRFTEQVAGQAYVETLGLE